MKYNTDLSVIDQCSSDLDVYTLTLHIYLEALVIGDIRQLGSNLDLIKKIIMENETL